MSKTGHITDDLFGAELTLLHQNSKIIKLEGDDHPIRSAYEDVEKAVQLVKRARETLKQLD